MPNLIVILFNLLYLVFIVGFNCKSCVIEKERVWRLKQLKTKEFFAGSSRLSIPRNDACALHMTGMRRVRTDGDSCVSRPFRETLASKSFPRDTRKTFCFSRLSFLIHTFYAYTIYTHITHRCWGVLQREKPSRKLWELEIVIPTYLYTLLVDFPQLLPLHFHIHERLIAQTLTTPILSVKWGFGRSHLFGGCNQDELHDPES